MVVILASGLKILLDSSESILFDPIVTILNQRILLAAEQMKIEDFYLEEEKEVIEENENNLPLIENNTIETKNEQETEQINVQENEKKEEK